MNRAIYVAAALAGIAGQPLAAGEKKSVHDFVADSIEGERTPLNRYKGKVLLIVNVASRCGFTKQYKGLQGLYTKYRGRGFEVLGFPSNDFLRQEPGTNKEIQSFCSTTFGVSFPMFAKIAVKGKDQHPLYRYLTSEETNPNHGGKITWNFNKFLVDRNGRVVARFGSRDKPDDPDLLKALEKALSN